MGLVIDDDSRLEVFVRALHTTLVIVSILSTLSLSTACGSLRDGASSTTDTSDASDQADISDPSDAADATEVTDPSDLDDPTESDDPSDASDCDRDSDGDLAEECGGTDCDDSNALVSGQRFEVCDFLDNNCDERINEGLDCTIYAHSSTELYKLDPFTTDLPLYVGEVPGIVDFDTSSGGELFGISSSTLYEYASSDRSWASVGSTFTTNGFANGFAIDQVGLAYISAGFNLYSIDLSSGEASLVGNFGETIRSSGDLVINKDNSLFMTSRLPDETTDTLVLLNPATGTGTVVGDTGFDRIFGLAFAWGNLFGFTDDGEVLLIDPYTAETELLVQHEGYVFYGSASSPER